MKLTSSIGVCKSKDDANAVAMGLIADGREDVWIEIPHLRSDWVNANLRYGSFWVNYTSGEDPSLDSHQPTDEGH